MTTNPFKQAILSQQVQIGLWANLCHPIATEVTAGAGFDWLLIDAEHAPNDVPIVLGHVSVIT